ncbi:PEPxxWA-CTERM sorting domain-containing protein [Bradyrhizobium japonicum]|uniref:PEPxxWA-CTERM sorting domain-containing protein n=1 Tax=Bradyrhizobium japonicum TaxID=375 RepID=UPI0018AD4639|nr:PEPxxWA-CTERM sorting domain-containing protein [Bradyrhizobium japonicum]
MSRFLPLAVGSILIASVCQVQAASILFSDGFEAPKVTHIPGPSGTAGGYDNYGTGSNIGPWTAVGPAGASDAVSVVTTDFKQSGFSFVAQSGQQWADLAGQNANGTEGVAITLTGLLGKTYSVSFWVGNVVDQPGGFFGNSTTVNLLVNGSQVYSAENTAGAGETTQAWQQFTFSDLAKTDAVTFTFLSGDPSDDYSSAFDSVVISEIGAVPEPATWAMMLVGFAGVGLMTYRRRDQRSALARAA